MTYDVTIIGAGAAGLMCAANIKNKKVLIIDHNNEVGKKIAISGGGKCNFTNLHCSEKNFISQNPKFCISALRQYTQHDFIKLVQSHNIEFFEKTLGQLFCNKSSKEIINMLLKEAKHAEFALNCSVNKVEKNNKYLLHTSNGRIETNNLVIASGGLSIPKIGTSSFGYEIAKQFGHKIIPPKPALVPLILDNDFVQSTKLFGVSCFAEVYNKLNKFKESILFTHKGLSGPAILQISSYWNKNENIYINFLPNDELKIRSNKSDEYIKTIKKSIPNKLANYLITELSLDKEILSKKDLNNLDMIHKFPIKAINSEGFKKAEVTSGGVSTDGVSSKNFESFNENLFFIGEVLDVTGHLGGFNFQWAWSSAYACAKYIESL